MRDVIIIGAGPAGLTAAIYLRGAGLEALVLEQMMPGGQMGTTPEIRNYPGFPLVGGVELSQQMRRHALEEGAEIRAAMVQALSPVSGGWSVQTGDEALAARCVILASGAVRRKLEVPGEAELSGAGVSYCAVCDGAFFRGKPVAVVGGGNTALEDALYLSSLCPRVTLIHRRNEFRGSPRLLSSVQAAENISLHTPAAVREIQGNGTVEGLLVEDLSTGARTVLPVSGVFIAVGTVASTALVQNLLSLEPDGRVAAGEDCVTELPGLFAAGDLRKKPQYQIITAAADGANAALSATQYLLQRKNK